jgi:oxidase EvaA
LSADYRSAEVSRRYPFADYVLAARPEQKLHDTRQSEEGGRFFREENRNMVVRADADFPHDLPRHFSWVPYRLLKSLLMHSNIVNVQARCLLNAVPSNAVPSNAVPLNAAPACGAGSGVAR